MDPQATWERLLKAYAAGEWDEIDDAARVLLAWMDRDGFPPQIYPGASLGPEWDRALARAGCLQALDMLRERWELSEAETGKESLP